MKKYAIIISTLLFWTFWACQDDPKTASEIQYDSYYDSIMVIHDRTMPLMGQLEDLRNQLKEERRLVLNSDANRYRKVVKLLGELNKAEDAMFDWMNGFNPDSISSDQKLNYIKSELYDVQHMEGLMLGGIGMAEMYLKDYGQPQN